MYASAQLQGLEFLTLLTGWGQVNSVQPPAQLLGLTFLCLHRAAQGLKLNITITDSPLIYFFFKEGLQAYPNGPTSHLFSGPQVLKQRSVSATTAAHSVLRLYNSTTKRTAKALKAEGTNST